MDNFAKGEIVDIYKTTQEQVDSIFKNNKQDRPEICITPGCDGKFHAKGICKQCYEVAVRLVRDGRTSWQKLEKEGKVIIGVRKIYKLSPRQKYFLGVDEVGT